MPACCARSGRERARDPFGRRDLHRARADRHAVPFDRLSGLAKDQVGYDARSGALFVFFGRRRDALKVLFFDGTGMCIFYNQPSSHYASFDLI